MTKLLGLALLVGVATPALPASPDAESPNRAVYLQYCGACHGPSGKGDGIAGTFMTKKPTDLTTIAKQNKGEFPYMHVMRVIDGRDTVRAHGDPDMPVWGEVFAEKPSAPVGQRIEIQGKLMLLTDYLRSIQEK